MQLESPALCAAAEVPAYEVKFLLSEREAHRVQEHLQTQLRLDDHADPQHGNTYQITSVYFDTPRFDVLAKADKYRRRKFRIRRYGDAPTVFLERKTKSSQEVRKKRTLIPLAELPQLRTTQEPTWNGTWFAAQLAKRDLQPVCVLSYHRMAFVGPSPTGPMRVTLDRHARGISTTDFVPELPGSGEPLLHDEVIAEFKFLGTMPLLFKEIIEGLRLTPQAVSKYRRCAAALGFSPAVGGGNA